MIVIDHDASGEAADVVAIKLSGALVSQRRSSSSEVCPVSFRITIVQPGQGGGAVGRMLSVDCSPNSGTRRRAART
jgi:hypothetical protein